MQPSHAMIAPPLRLAVLAPAGGLVASAQFFQVLRAGLERRKTMGNPCGKSMENPWETSEKYGKSMENMRKLWEIHGKYGETNRWEIQVKYGKNMAVCQNLVPLVNIKIVGKWMFLTLKMVLIGFDPYPYRKISLEMCANYGKSMENVRNIW